MSLKAVVNAPAILSLPVAISNTADPDDDPFIMRGARWLLYEKIHRDMHVSIPLREITVSEQRHGVTTPVTR